MKSKNWQEPSWEHLRNDDHRSLLKKIVSAKGSEDVVYQLCSPWLHLIVEELHFGSQKTSALTLLPHEVSRISKEYLSWIKQDGLWEQLNTHWLQQAKGPWSIPLFLAIGYKEFLESQYPEMDVKESSLSYKRAIVEYSTRTQVPSNRVVGAMAEQIVESFAAWTNTLSEKLKTVFQLYLEGLLENEIGSILGLNPNEVRSRIEEAKAELGVSKDEAV